MKKSCVNFILRNKIYLEIIYDNLETNMRTKDSQCHIPKNKFAIHP